jgi:predicted dehydrogenase
VKNRADKINVGVIGVGWFGEFHARLYKQLQGANLIGVCDADIERAQEVAARLDTRFYADAEELLAEESIAAVSICTTDQYHLEPTLAACQAGKHILVEKPMALDTQECDQMIAAAKEAGVKLMVAHILRFSQRYVAAHELIRSGEIGTVRHFYGRRNNPRRAARRLGARCGYHTIVFHNAVHDIDIMNWFAGSEVIEAYAMSQSGEMEDEGYPMSDTVLSMLKFRSGAGAIMENCWTYPDTYPTLVDAVTEVTGTHGKLVLDFQNKGAVSYSNSGVGYFENAYWPEIYGLVAGDLHQELEHFLYCVAEDRPVPVSGEDGRKAVAAAAAIVASLESGKPEPVR